MIFKILVYISSAYTVSSVYKKYLGVRIGKNARFTGKDIGFGSEPFLIEIGDNCTITGGVIFQTHDGGVGVFRQEYPGINVFGRIVIGNNVFIGNRVIIMPGITIGNNVVIGAGSIVTKDIPSDSVVAGVPARMIKTIHEYKESILKKAVFVKSITSKEREVEITKYFAVRNATN